MPKVISRAEAKVLGLKRYFTGKPCKHGHCGCRLVSNRQCVGCANVRDLTAYKHEHYIRNRSKVILRTILWKKMNPEKQKKHLRDYAHRRRRKNDLRFRELKRGYDSRWYYEGPINPKGEKGWLRKNRAQLRALKRTLRNLGVDQLQSEA